MILHVDKAEDLASRETIASMSGLEFIQAIQRGELPSPPISKTLDYWMEEAVEGKVTFRGKPSFKAMNPIGTIHGGWFGTLLDSCMACAVQTMLPVGLGYTTLEYKVNVIRPLFSDSDEVLAIGEASHVGRRTGIAEGRIVGAQDGKLYATASTTCMVFSL